MARAVKEKLFLFEKVQSLGNGLHALDLCLEREFPDVSPSPSHFAVVWKSEAVLETRICLGQYICVSGAGQLCITSTCDFMTEMATTRQSPHVL